MKFLFDPSDATEEDHLPDAEAEADLAARCPHDVVGDWLLSLPKGQAVHAQTGACRR